MLKMYFPPAKKKKNVPTTGILNEASSLCLVQDCLLIGKTPLHFGKNSLKRVLNVKNWEVKITFTGKRNRQEKRVLFANCIWSFRKLVMIFLIYYEKNIFGYFSTTYF